MALGMVCFIVPGALMSIRIADRKWLSLRGSIAGALLLFTFGILGVFTFAYNAETSSNLWFFIPFLGWANGWAYPSQRNLLIALMPGGCEAEIMGFYQFCSMILNWAPSLFFLVLNEALGSLRVAVLILPVFWFIGLAILMCVDVDKGRDEVKATLELRMFGEVSNAEGGDVDPSAPKSNEQPKEVELRAGEQADATTDKSPSTLERYWSGESPL